MGLLTPGNKRGVGAALLSIGQSMEDQRKEKAAKAQQDEVNAREERRLKMQETESRQRQEINKFKLQTQRAQKNNAALAQAVTTAEYHPKFLGPAMSKNIDDGFNYDFNEGKSVPGKEPGQYDTITFDITTTEQKGEGLAGVGGVPTKVAMPGGMSQKVFTTDAEYTASEKYVNWMNWQLNPNTGIANTMAEHTGEKNRKKGEQIHKDRIKNDPDYAAKWASELELAKLAPIHKQAQIDKLKAESTALGVKGKKEPAGSFKTLGGQTINQTSQEIGKADKFAASLNKTEDFVDNPVSSNHAAKIMHMQDDAKSQEVIDKIMAQVKSEDEFVAAFGNKLPETFLRKMYVQRGGLDEEEASGNWLGNWINSFTN